MPSQWPPKKELIAIHKKISWQTKISWPTNPLKNKQLPIVLLDFELKF